MLITWKMLVRSQPDTLWRVHSIGRIPVFDTGYVGSSPAPASIIKQGGIMTLNRETYDAIRNASNPVEKAISRAQNLYNKLLKKGGISGSDKLWLDGDYSYYNDCIEVNWEETWRYGGYDSGLYYIPVEALFDDTWEAKVTELTNAVINKRDEEIRDEKAQVERREKTVLKELKAKYE